MNRYYFSVALLKQHGCCDHQVDVFKQIFGTGKVFVTPNNYRKAVEAFLDVTWPAFSTQFEIRHKDAYSTLDHERSQELRDVVEEIGCKWQDINRWLYREDDFDRFVELLDLQAKAIALYKEITA